MWGINKLTALAASLVLITVACTNTNPGVATNQSRNLQCADAVFDLNSGRPTNIVRIGALPSEFDDSPAVRMTGPEEFDALTIPIAPHPEAGSYFVIPVLASNPVAGGAVQMQLIDASGNECDATDFQIEALPNAPGAFAEFAAELENLNAATNEAFGVDPTDENAEPSPLTQPFKTTHEWLEGTENPNSIDKILDGTAEISADITDEAERLLDGLIEESGVLEHIQESIDEITEIIDPPTETEDPPGQDAPPEVPVPTIGDEICQRIGGDLSAQTLSRLMRTQGGLERFRADTDLILDGVGLLNSVVGVGSLVLTGGVPNPVTAVNGVLSVSLSAYDVLSDAAIHLLPGELVDLDFDYEQPRYLEDEPDLSGYWENVNVTARGTEWNLDGRIFEQVLKRATGGLSKRFITKHGADKAAAATGRFLTETFSESTTAALEAHRDSQGFVNIPPCEFGPVDISSPEFHEADFFLPNRPAAITGDREFEIVDTGKGRLVIRARADKFGGATAFKSEPVAADPIEITIDPPVADGDPGFVAVFTVTVENAHDIGVDVTLEPSGGHEMQIEQIGANIYEITVLTSTERADFPALLRVESTASTGLRAKPDAPARVATARIGSDGGITLNPRMVCLEYGEEFQFEAEVHEFDNKDINWHVSAGTINPSGLFTAPKSDTTLEVRAEAAADPARAAVSKVTVAETCRCWASFELPLRGVHEVGSSGTITFGEGQHAGQLQSVHFDMEEGGQVVVDFSNPLNSNDPNPHPNFPNEGPKAGETGRYLVHLQEGNFEPTGNMVPFFGGPAVLKHLGGIRYSEHGNPKEKDEHWAQSHATVDEFILDGDVYWLDTRISGDVWIDDGGGNWRMEPARMYIQGEFVRSLRAEELFPGIGGTFMQPWGCGKDAQW